LNGDGVHGETAPEGHDQPAAGADVGRPFTITYSGQVTSIPEILQGQKFSVLN
jgi:hypothetical protein